jgi:hypothetical protein
MFPYFRIYQKQFFGKKFCKKRGSETEKKAFERQIQYIQGVTKYNSYTRIDNNNKIEFPSSVFFFRMQKKEFKSMF